MYIKNLLEDVQKLKIKIKQLELDKAIAQTQLDTFKKVDYANLSQKLKRFKQIALSKLIKEAVLNKKTVNLTYELSKAENSLIGLNENNQHLINTNTDLEDKINALEVELSQGKINKEEFAKKLLELNDLLKRPISLAEKLTIPASDWTYLHNVLGNITKISEENLFSIKEKEEQINKLQAEKVQLEKDRSNLQTDLGIQVKLLEDELAKEKLTDEEKEIIEIIQRNLNDIETMSEKLKGKQLENLPHLKSFPMAVYSSLTNIINLINEIDSKKGLIKELQTEIQEVKKKTELLETKIRELENKDRDTLELLRTANSQRDGIAAERDLLQAKIGELKNKASQLELELKLIQEELTTLRGQNQINQENTERTKRDLETKIKDLEGKQLTSNELNINKTLQEMFNLTSVSGLTMTNIEEVKKILNKLKTYTLTGNPNLADLPAAIYDSMNAFVHSQEIIWEREKQVEEKIRALEKEINLQVGEKNKLLESLGIYRKSFMIGWKNEMIADNEIKTTLANHSVGLQFLWWDGSPLSTSHDLSKHHQLLPPFAWTHFSSYLPYGSNCIIKTSFGKKLIIGNSNMTSARGYMAKELLIDYLY